MFYKEIEEQTARECIFRVSGGTYFENFSALRQPWWRLRGFDMCTSLPKKTLDTSLLIDHGALKLGVSDKMIQ